MDLTLKKVFYILKFLQKNIFKKFLDMFEYVLKYFFNLANEIKIKI
jgi:hypothetical protein